MRIEKTPDFQRIASLPIKVWDPEMIAKAQEYWTDTFRRPSGIQTLKPIQAIALSELKKTGGLFANIQVGSGKTLISFFAPEAVGSRRPMLLLPGGLLGDPSLGTRGKTENDLEEASINWKVPNYLRMESYNRLSLESHENMLFDYLPDLIICDEAHHLSNTKNAATKRIQRYISAYPETKLVFMSGTISKRNIDDFIHMMFWALKSGAPVPYYRDERILWGKALDGEDVYRRPDASAIASLKPSNRETDPLRAARIGFQYRLASTWGVVITDDAPVNPRVRIRERSVRLPAEPMRWLQHLTDSWEMPDGRECMDAVEVWRHAREISLGFFYRWNPQPPKSWLDPRRDWAKYVRSILTSANCPYDTEKQVRSISRELPVLRAWEEVKKTFKPHVELVWIDPFAVSEIDQWRRSNSSHGIIWCEHSEFARQASDSLGLNYFGAKGLNASGELIDRQSGDQTVMASIRANKEGRNLQKFYHNFIVSCPPTGRDLEQLLGRTDRPGQKRQEVYFDFFISSEYLRRGIESALNDARYTEDTLGQAQKMLTPHYTK